ncbi:hypothetical protein K435DRAFT_859134 [Dendrothele bispora CBS 962.96]|uniref:Uncharacterized protein n=1 Tax=Dendrothele bispora (strain CBS 962.96) TaxID=1314807 RepID=A0A4S8M2F3_DENBC|nr:hypothetical protein K435DRAFT_859134 [Dendrothele bispora CBS 962.96]
MPTVRIRHIVLHPGETVMISMAPAAPEQGESENICPDCHEALQTASSPPPPTPHPQTPTPHPQTPTPHPQTPLTPPPPFTSLPSLNERALNIPHSSIQPSITYRAYKTVPHPNTLEAAWPHGAHVKVHAVFRGSRIGVFPQRHWDIIGAFTLNVSGAYQVKYSRFDGAMDEYRRRYYGSNVTNRPKILSAVPNSLWDVSDPLFDCDLEVVIPEDDSPYVMPVDQTPALVVINISDDEHEDDGEQ